MPRQILLTGSASGIGAATYKFLGERGYRVIGVDLRNAEIEVDLGTAAGRDELVRAAAKLAPNGLDSVIACAGVAHAPPESVVAVNYFGAVATLEGLHPLLARTSQPRAVVVASSASILPTDEPVVKACLAGDETLARTRAQEFATNVYASSKKAIALWVRRTAIANKWAGAGIPLNAVAPGTIKTPMTMPLLATEEGRATLAQATPVATPDYGEPTDIAEVLTMLATLETRYLLGQVVFVDGGTDVFLRPDTV